MSKTNNLPDEDDLNCYSRFCSHQFSSKNRYKYLIMKHYQMKLDFDHRKPASSVLPDIEMISTVTAKYITIHVITNTDTESI